MRYYNIFQGKSQSSSTDVPDEWEKRYDVVVAGGGNAGVYAAIAAAREGKTVLLIEKSNWCGGMHVQGLVNGYYYGIRGGLYTDTDQKSEALAKSVFYNQTDAKRFVVGKQLEENGVEVATASFIIGIYAEDQTIKGVDAVLQGARRSIACRMLIDATSDGHVLRMLPVNTWMGRKTDHEVQPFSSVRCVYLDTANYDGGLRVSAGDMSGRFGVYHEYRDNGYVNQYNEEEFTQAIIRAHASHLRTLAPAARFLYLSPVIGVREGILYEGEQTLTLKNVLEEKEKPENVLVYSFSDVDKHGSDMAFDEDAYQDWFVNCNMSTCTVYIPLPTGAVTPRGWKGIITSGRCLSMDSYVNSAVRMNADTFRIGEACGILAALAADCGQDTMAIPYETLKNRLQKRGLLSTAGEDMRPSFWTPARGADRRYVTWMTDPQEIKEALNTDCPAVALWSCRLLGKAAMGDAVFEMMQSENEMLRYNAAVALGVMNDERALPVLREIIRNRRPFYFMDCRRSNQMRSVIAICLCGRMADQDAMPELLEIIKPQEFEKPIYHELLEPRYELSIVKEQNSVYFQHFSHAVAALVKIAGAHKACREEIRAALHDALDDETYISRITQMPEHNAYYQAALNCKRYFMANLSASPDSQGFTGASTASR